MSAGFDGRGGARAPARALVGALMCVSCGTGPKDPEQRAAEVAPAAARAPPATVAGICSGEAVARAEVPDDARLAILVDLEAVELPAALERVEAWGRAPDGAVPVVAGLALSQIGFQLGLVRELLASIGIAPRSLLILQAPGGELVWSFHLACDLDGLRELVSGRWGLRTRSSVLGVIAEAAAPGAFAYDLVVASGDEIALTPTGSGGRLLRWQTRSTTSIAGARAAGRLGEALGAIPPAPLRAVLAWGGASRVVTAGGEILWIRADGAQMEAHLAAALDEP